MKTLLSIALAFFCFSANAGDEACLPKEAGGEGSELVKDAVSLSWTCPLGAKQTIVLPVSEQKDMTFDWGRDKEASRKELLRLWSVKINGS